MSDSLLCFYFHILFIFIINLFLITEPHLNQPLNNCNHAPEADSFKKIKSWNCSQARPHENRNKIFLLPLSLKLFLTRLFNSRTFLMNRPQVKELNRFQWEGHHRERLTTNLQMYKTNCLYKRLLGRWIKPVEPYYRPHLPIWCFYYNHYDVIIRWRTELSTYWS